MFELAKKYLDKEVLIDTLSQGTVEGVIIEAVEGGISVQTKSGVSAINLDFVIRIREYPRNKKGKKKAIVLD